MTATGYRYRLRSCDPGAAAELGRAVGVSPTVAQLLMHRGMQRAEQAKAFLTPQLSGLSSPSAMADRQPAADRLATAIRDQQQVVVFGDYDVDGITSAALLSLGLKALGARVQTLIADRFAGGYGFSAAALSRVLSLSPSLVVTCDCGSSDHPRLQELRAQGVSTIVVDHHLVPDEPLPVDAFLNPHRPDCGFPFKGMCSAGLALSLVAAVRTALGCELDVRQYLDLVALGTIADVAPLLGDNRRLVRAGLQRLASEKARPGVVALRELAKLRPDAPISALDVAFRLTPRLNAPGRLGRADLTLALLLAEDLDAARPIAQEVEACNQERKAIEKALTAAAVEQVLSHYGEQPVSGIVAAAPDFHPGVVGVTAARLVDRFQVPAVVVSLAEPHGHGSARAPDGFPLYDAIARCASSLVRFGGHQAASGVTLAPSQLAAFREQFATAVTAVALQPTGQPMPVDLQLGVGPFGLPSARELGLLEPVGEANDEPLFHLPRAVVVSASEVGEGHLKLRLMVNGQRLSAFGFQLAAQGLPQSGVTVQVLGSLRPDTWVGGDAVELRLLQVLPEHAALVELEG